MAEDEIRLFTLKEAEKTRVELEPTLIEAVETRRKMGEHERTLSELGERIARSGGMSVSYDHAARARVEYNRLEETLRDALERFEEAGCLVKDLDIGLVDFPARLNDQDIYFCWRLGEDRIRFYHRRDEGFSGRKPIDPHDTSGGDVVH